MCSIIVGLQISQHQRGRFWIKESFSGNGAAVTRSRAAEFLNEPPADTNVLLGYVKDEYHWHWIVVNQLYNLRADNRRGSVGLASPQLSCDLIVLSCPKLDRSYLAKFIGQPRLINRKTMVSMDYPDPRGELYFCLEIEPVNNGYWDERISTRIIEGLRIKSTTLPAPRPSVAGVIWRKECLFKSNGMIDGLAYSESVVTSLYVNP